MKPLHARFLAVAACPCSYRKPRKYFLSPLFLESPPPTMSTTPSDGFSGASDQNGGPPTSECTFSCLHEPVLVPPVARTSFLGPPGRRIDERSIPRPPAGPSSPPMSATTIKTWLRPLERRSLALPVVKSTNEPLHDLRTRLWRPLRPPKRVLWSLRPPKLCSLVPPTTKTLFFGASEYRNFVLWSL